MAAKKKQQKIELKRSDLLKGLSRLSGVIQGRPEPGKVKEMRDVTQTELVCLEFTKDGLYARGFYPERSLRVRIADCSFEYKELLPVVGSTLFDLVSNVGTAEVELMVSDIGEVFLSYGVNKSKLRVHDLHEHYGRVEFVEPKKPTADFSLPAQTLEEVYKRVQLSVAGDKNRDELKVIQFLKEGDDLIVTAIDGIQLSSEVIKKVEAEAIPEKGLLIYGYQIQALRPALNGGDVRLVADLDWLTVIGDDFIYRAQQPAYSTFPDWKQILPDMSKYKGFELDYSEFVGAVARALIMTDSDHQSAKFTVDGKTGEISIASTPGELGKTVTKVEAKKGKDALIVKMDVSRLRAMLSTLKGEKVTMHLSKEDGTKLDKLPVLFTFQAFPNYRFVLMPMELR